MKYFANLVLKPAVLVGLTATCFSGLNALASSEKPAEPKKPATKVIATIGGIDKAPKPAKDDDHGSKKPHWAYEGTGGPATWGQLSADFAMCGDGVMQSPINFGDTFGAGGAAIEFDYKVTAMDLVHNGHTVQLNYEPGSSMTVDGKRYDLLQLHFHTPSEHAIASKQSAMEMHLVHKNAAGELAVVGVMMDIGGTNRPLSELWAHMPETGGQTYRAADVLVNARDFLPATRTYYRYMGSLTTPPCSEGVNWFVLNTPMVVGIEQVKRFADSVGFNARPLQPKSKRLVIAPLQ